MTPKDTDHFVSERGTEVSVRTFRDRSGDALLIEPLYATDIELLDGATGELRTGGETLRGTLRRDGGRFVFAPEPPRAAVTADPLPAPVSRPASAPTPRPAAPPGPPPAAAEPASTHAEALQAAEAMIRFVRGDADMTPSAARRALTALGRFIAAREGQEGRR